VKFAFASCNHPYWHPSQPGWLELAEHQPDVLLMMGDNTYIEQHPWEIFFNKPVNRLDDDAFAAYLHERYERQWWVPEYQELVKRMALSQAPVMGTLDDHDFLGNDYYVTPETQNKARIARVLHRQFIAASNGPIASSYPALPDWRVDPDAGFEQGLGCASAKRWGPIKLVVLDNRSYREKPGELAVAFGQRQLDWLRMHLACDQKISLVCSGSTLLPGSKWWARGSAISPYRQEYEQLRQIYLDNAQQCIVHLAGDLHYNEWRGRKVHGHFVEVCSSGMGTGWQPFAFTQNANFGLAEWSDNTLRIRTFGDEGERNYDKSLPVAV
jgi:PhoD-like phosphatase